MRRQIRVLPLALAVLLAVSAVGCGKEAGTDPAGSAVEETSPMQQSAGETGNESGNAQETKNDESAPAGETSAHAVGSREDDYILPEAQTHVYTQEELSGLSKEELRIARNEIYARHGREFKSEELKTHFTKKAWYQPGVAADSFDDAVLNEAERKNLKAIQAAEEQAVSGVIACPKIGREEFPVIDGSTATIPISQAIYRLATGASKQEAESHISHGKTTQSYLNLIWGNGASLVIAYEPGDAVKERLKEEGDNIIMKPIGRDALVFMANESNPVKSLTQKQVVDIYSGKLTDWKALGGRNQEIKAFQRPKNSGSQNLMEKLVMGGKAMADAPQDFVVSEMGELIEQVSAYDNTGDALGYSVYFYAKNMYQKPELKFMGINGVMPASETIRDGSYPFVNDFYAAIRKDEPKDSAAYQLFEWLTSDDGQALINALGYVGTKDVGKALPEGWDEEAEKLTGKIPLPDGSVILGDGAYLYGENGIAVFDQSMNLLKFIRHTAASEVASFYVCREDSILCMQDTLSGLYGVYSLKEDRWKCRPEYTRAFPVDDGFCLERGVWEGTAENGSWHYTYDYADREGRIVKTAETSEQRIWSGEDTDSLYLGSQEFAEKYPEILEHLGVGSEALSIYGTEFQENIAVITKGNREYYYDMSGTLLFTFDLDRLKGLGDTFRFPILAGDRISYLQVYKPGSSVERYYVYRDGTLVKEMEADETEGRISNIRDGFYVRTKGNYSYVCNFDDEPCAKFLQGYYTSD